MSGPVVERAIVLGGSMAGLLTARVLSESVAEVVIVDRDSLVDVTGYRDGVPHGRHAHGLVARGQQILEELFPGLTQRLIDFGVAPGDLSGDIRWYVNGLRLKPAATGLISVPATRPVLERHVRESIQKIPNVRLQEHTEVLEPTVTDDRARVTGVRVAPVGGGAAEVLSGDVVVDTTGRGSRTPAWLADLGYDRPQDERVPIRLAYTTRHYRLTEDPFGSDIAIIPAATPSHPRGAVFYRLPGDEGLVELSVTGVQGDYPPTDHEGFTEFVRSLPVPEIYAAIRDAEPVDDPVRFTFPASVRRHYERLKRFPDGLLVLGDAICSFNPVYAQGMTVSAMQAMRLRELIGAGGTLPDAATFFRAMSRVIDPPWELSAGADLEYPGVEGRRTVKSRMANAYVARLQRAAVHDEQLTDAFIRTMGLVVPPTHLMRPGNVVRVLRHARRPGPDGTGPNRPLVRPSAA